jgi:putative component of toxin-antitoxin plasmid stabilization module
MNVTEREVEYYEDENGWCPFEEWMKNLRDPVGKAQIDKRISRLQLGLLGEWDDVGEGGS